MSTMCMPHICMGSSYSNTGPRRPLIDPIYPHTFARVSVGHCMCMVVSYVYIHTNCIFT